MGGPVDAQRRKLAAEITASVESDKTATARDADIEKVRSYYLEPTRSAPGFRVTKNGIEHQMDCALEQISTRTSACSCSVRNWAH
jgi:hypothetical protein